MLAAPPEITIQPVSQAVEEGSIALFRVFTPDPTTTYQWFKNGEAIPGGTESVYPSYNTSLSDCAMLQVRLRNSDGATWSREVELMVSPQDARPGMIDTSFSVGKINGGGVRAMARDSQGRIYLGGLLDAVEGRPSLGVARVDSSGQLDAGFTAELDGEVKSILVHGNHILVGGSFTQCNGTACLNFVRIDEAGNIQNGFGSSFNDEVNVIKADREGRIYVGGRFTSFDGTAVKQAVRFGADLQLDPSFIAEGINASVHDIILSSNSFTLPVTEDLIYLSGGFSGRVKRLLADGSNDPTFANGFVTNGIITDLALDENQQVLAVNTIFPPLVRLANDGSLDASFTPNPNGFVFDVATVGGDIYLSGDFTSINNQSVRGIARLTESGAVDTNFIPPPINGPVHTFSLDDTSILIGGDFQFPHSDTMRLLIDPPEVPNASPVIQCPPQDRELRLGEQVTLSVVADTATSWQWYRNGSFIQGATGPLLNVAEVGDYHVVIANTFGSETSEVAIVEEAVLTTGLPISYRYAATPQMMEVDNETTITIPVSSDFIVSKVRVHLVFRHEKINDFTADLESPNGTVTRLFRRPGRRGIDLIATLDDEGINELEDATAPWRGTWRPDERMIPHEGQIATGEWKLHISKRNRPNNPLGPGELEKLELELIEERPPLFQEWQDRYEGGLLDFALLRPLDSAAEIQDLALRDGQLYFCHYRWKNVPGLEYRYEKLEGDRWNDVTPEIVETEDLGDERQYLHLRLPTPVNAELIRLKVRQN